MTRNNIEYIIWGNASNIEKASKEIQQGIYIDQISLIADLHEIGTQRKFDLTAWNNLLIQKSDEIKKKLADVS